ncbi:cytochrome c class I [Neoasaia chiangmaiensis NBRC 101099]|nr:cytochrome c [Neoasaia chiangmaiensis]GBR40964.1 cytochrome c class I [Neoasaia chiangmaiensis NBRC 101099]GEN13668.1 hypothetical protein NCH01_00990 [Neoasaia chiangmaiensis]
MRFPLVDRSLRLPLILALAMVGVFIINRNHANRDLGFRDYGEQCGICHHGGRGQAAETPPLFGRIDQIADSPEGKHYIIDVLLNGLSGPITATGQTFSWSMPAFNRRSDEEIARILTWVARQGHMSDPPVFTAADIAAQRRHPRSSEEVHDEREHLDATHPLP